jgi:hypothetical protein
METWISAVRAKKMFGLSKAELESLEAEGKVQVILIVGNNKLYSVGDLQTSKSKFIFFKNILSKIFKNF